MLARVMLRAFVSASALLATAIAWAGCASVWPFSMYYLRNDAAPVAAGAKAPAFDLESATGGRVTLDSIRARGKPVVVFYRGAW